MTADQDRVAAEARSSFPEWPRVIYKHNPLVEVVCQLRFAPILRIDSEPPAEFQECIRAQFPVLTERNDDAFQLPSGFPAQIADIVRSSMIRPTTPSSYNFTTEDGVWTLRLSRDFLSLATLAYERWEDFKTRFGEGFDALLKVYRPAFFSRVGLRYQNLIQRSKLKLDREPWSALLKPRIAGLVGDANLDISEALSVVSIRLPGAGQVRIRHGLGQQVGAPEECYLIDSDFFTEERTGTGDAYKVLDYFNSQSGRLFRWCIEDRLHDAMEPEQVG